MKQIIFISVFVILISFSLSFAQNDPTSRAVIDDFQVNENAGGARQLSVSIAVSANGKSAMCWEDERNSLGQIYAQVYNEEGQPLGENFKVNDDFTENVSTPDVAIHSDGSFAICWRDGRNGYSDIYAQRYNGLGIPLGNNFKVNEELEQISAANPAISVNGDGGFVICWEDSRSGNYDIYGQRYDNLGNPLGENFIVNDDGQSWSQNNPSISSDENDNFVITWADERNDGNPDIYAQRYDASGTPLGSNFIVNEDGIGSDQILPSVAMNAAGEFLIAWEDGRNGDLDQDVYAQIYSSNGQPVAGNFRVNNDIFPVDQGMPSVACDSTEVFIISWHDARRGVPYEYEVYCQRYSSDGTLIGSNTQVGDDGALSQYDSDVGMDNSGKFFVCWKDYRNGNWDIYGQNFDENGNKIDTNYQINDDVGSSEQFSPAIAVDDSGAFVICWQDRRENMLKIYGQRYTRGGEAIGPNFSVENESNAGSPAIAMNSDGAFVICWHDSRENNSDIYFQRYNSAGEPQGGNIKVNDDDGTGNQWDPSIGMDNQGNFVICWTDERNNVLTSDIYVQRYNDLGVPDGENVNVQDVLGARGVESSISMNPSGDYVVCWVDFRHNNSPDIFAQRYDSEGYTMGDNVRVSTDEGDNPQSSPDISLSEDGEFVIAWEDGRDGNSDIYAQQFFSSGSPSGVNFRVNDDTEQDKSKPAIAIDDDGNFIITWQDHNSGHWNIYGQRYHNTCQTYGDNFLVTSTTEQNQESPDIVLRNEMIYNTWQTDHTPGTSLDIWANVLEWEVPAVEVSQNQLCHHIPKQVHLSQNYPNPFNPNTILAFTIPHSGGNTRGVKLRIYDTSGKLIKTLIDEPMEPGYHSVVWNGKDDAGQDVASGVYFYRLKTDEFTETKECLLIK